MQRLSWSLTHIFVCLDLNVARPGYLSVGYVCCLQNLRKSCEAPNPHVGRIKFRFNTANMNFRGEQIHKQSWKKISELWVSIFYWPWNWRNCHKNNVYFGIFHKYTTQYLSQKKYFWTFRKLSIVKMSILRSKWPSQMAQKQQFSNFNTST